MATVNLKDVLHLYIGCEIKTHPDFLPNRDAKTETKGISILTPGLYCDLMYNTFPGSIGSTWQPILRNLESITVEEALEFAKLIFPNAHSVEISHNQVLFKYYHEDVELPGCLDLTWTSHEHTIWLAKHGFDLFGLIESGQVIDADTLTNKPQQEV